MDKRVRDKKNVNLLLLSPFFYPEQISTGKYNTALAQALVERGIKVKIIASYPLYPEWKPRLCVAPLAGIEIYRAGDSIRYPRSAYLRRFILELWFSLHATLNAWRFRANTQYAVLIFPPSLFFVFVDLVLPRSVRRIGIVHDLQGIYAAQSIGLAARIVYQAIRFIEKRVFRRCDKLIFLSSAMRKSAIEAYKLLPHQCVVCYPFVALSESVETHSLCSIFPKNMRHVVYSGALGEKQNPSELVEFMELFAEAYPEVMCHILSGGPIYGRLVNEQAGGLHKHVKFHPLVSEELLAELYACSDVQIIPQAPGTGNASLPSKFPNLLMAGVPIFAICDDGSELAVLVRDTNAGLVSPVWNRDKLLKDMKTFLEGLHNENRSERIKRNGAFLQSKFSVMNVVARILD
jgi:colanic acid biosynthesis glycosyl transferase WcaI